MNQICLFGWHVQILKCYSPCVVCQLRPPMNILLWKQYKQVINKCCAFAYKSEGLKRHRRATSRSSEIQITAVVLSETHPSGWEVRWTPPKHVSLFVELLFNWFRSDALICTFWDRRKVFYQGSCGESEEDRLLWLPSDSIARLCIPSEYGARKEAEIVERGIGMGWVRAQSPKTPPLSWSSPGVKHGSPRELTGSQWLPSSVTRGWHQIRNDSASR